MNHHVSKRVKDIKKAQKEKLLFREISDLLGALTLEDERLKDFWVSRVSLSADKSICSIFFYTFEPSRSFDDFLQILKLYKPSLRKAIASRIESRYTPELIFKYDQQYEKSEKINALIDQVATDTHD